jgi:hypothetical protein
MSSVEFDTQADVCRCRLCVSAGLDLTDRGPGATRLSSTSAGTGVESRDINGIDLAAMRAIEGRDNAEHWRIESLSDLA